MLPVPFALYKNTRSRNSHVLQNLKTQNVGRNARDSGMKLKFRSKNHEVCQSLTLVYLLKGTKDSAMVKKKKAG